MQTNQSWRHWFDLGLLSFGVLLWPAGSGRILAENKVTRVVVNGLVVVKESQQYPTVYHYLYDKGKGLLREQQRHLQRIPRTVRKLLFVQTPEDRLAEVREEVLREFEKELEVCTCRVAMMERAMKLQERVNAKLAGALPKQPNPSQPAKNKPEREK